MNRLQLQAVVVQTQSLRYTPAGIPVLNLVLEHGSQQTELDMPRAVQLQIRAVAFGALAESLQQQALNVTMDFGGFLANARNGKGVVFHIQAFSKT